MGAGISSFKGWGKYILSNSLQRAIDLCIVGRRSIHACATEKRNNDINLRQERYGNDRIKRKAAEVFMRFR
jgi:hypothetical protein